ncbi:MAG TPA: hypothetical protein PKY77_08505 [Phycisphaerae bacterium]|nr:hypothetical protein [Phycisphaerae bacterium]HRY68734.1 hypothetical protein [Phycisphaerae bacterium]HSA29551.1 hypothetical protein [Phycisphaerae bacterium]
MAKAKKPDPLMTAIEHALFPGQFIPYGQMFHFAEGLDLAKNQVDALVKQGQSQRAVDLYEVFLSGCYDKAGEVDDSGANLSMFFEDLFISWIQARQKAGCPPEETVRSILSWMHNDDYGLCYRIHGPVAKALNATGYRLFRSHFENLLREAFATQENTQTPDQRPYSTRAYGLMLKLKEIYHARGDLRAYLALCHRIDPSPKDCGNIAGMLKARKRFADALPWVEKGLALKDDDRWRHEPAFGLDKLRQDLLVHLGRRQEAIDAAWSSFEQRPSHFGYDELMRYVPKKNVHTWHEKAMQVTRRAPLSAFLEICTHTKEWGLLAERVNAADDEELEDISHFVNEPAAEGLAKGFPLTAAKVHRALGMRIVKSAKSKYYGYALEHLSKARRLYEVHGQAERWQSLVEQLRRDHRRKSGFMAGFEQIAAAGSTPRSLTFAEKARRRWENQASDPRACD